MDACEDQTDGFKHSEHLSDTLNSLSLSSLLTPSSIAPPQVKKCNSAGSLDQARAKDATSAHARPQTRPNQEDLCSSKITDANSRKHR